MNGARNGIDETFPKCCRLLKSEDYSRLFKGNIRLVDPRFTILASRNGFNYPRLGLAISKRKVKHAVDRNSLKRLIRESFRQHKRYLKGLDLVVMSRSEFVRHENGIYIDSLARRWLEIAKKCGVS